MADLRTSTYDADTSTDSQWAFAKPSKESSPTNDQLPDMPWYFGDMGLQILSSFI